MGRAHFDSKSPIELKKHNVQLWPGYFTSVGSYMNSISLIVDTSYKVIRTDTILDSIEEISRKTNAQNFKMAVEQSLLGTIALTRYNNKTYRIDGIAWHMNPNSSFERGKGDKSETISFAKYMSEQYDKTIRVANQPLLINNNKGRPLYLIPELCYSTGISPKMRTDFIVMRDLAQTTSLSPEARHKEIVEFIKEVTSNPKAIEVT